MQISFFRNSAANTFLHSRFNSLIVFGKQVYIFHVEAHPNFPWYTQCVTFHSFPSPAWEMAYTVFGIIMIYLMPLVKFTKYNKFYSRVLVCRVAKFIHAGKTIEIQSGIFEHTQIFPASWLNLQ